MGRHNSLNTLDIKTVKHLIRSFLLIYSGEVKLTIQVMWKSPPKT
ncbi:hypothetical protein GXM_00734 [Nostoc sphaeroides CCNUC1]|uniref:Uncharacterized protein n=1 Tax=Nostoc sphaeroides CCNUC1 TaxID=2653204 RepID=A0A5P8VSH0_9NOSO|nr:hypothetical protein GXM_00734 [Nostoc sphaeroides CCNUC1]